MARGDSYVIVLGEHRYRVVHPWNRDRLGHISQLAVDAAGRVHVFQRSGSPVVVLAPDGALAASWGAEVADPHGIFIAADGRILLVDRDSHQVLIYDGAGRLQSRLGERHAPRFGLPFNHPTDVAVGPDGDIYVSDGYGNAHVHRFGPDGAHKLTWGGIGSGPGQFSTPHGIWVTPDNRVLVGDRENNRIQVFAPDGRFLAEWGDLYHPMDIWGAADGTVYVTDQAPRLVAFAPDGRVLGRAKVVATQGHGLWGDAQGNLWQSEYDGWITKLERV